METRERASGVGSWSDRVGSGLGSGRPGSPRPAPIGSTNGFARGQQRAGAGFKEATGAPLAGPNRAASVARRRLLDMKGRDGQAAAAGDLVYIPFGSVGELDSPDFRVMNDFVAYDLRRTATWYSVGVPPDGPVPRARAAVAGSGVDMASSTAKLWIYGGTTGPDPGHYLNDFWVFVAGNQSLAVNSTWGNYTRGNNHTAYNATLNAPTFNNVTNATSAYWKKLTPPPGDADGAGANLTCGRRGASLHPWTDVNYPNKLYLVLFGGHDGCTGPRGDRVAPQPAISAADWNSPGPRTQPPPREEAAVEVHGNQLFVFGGANEAVRPPTFLGDTWAFDLGQRRWVELDTDVNGSISSSPPARAGAASFLLLNPNSVTAAPTWIVSGGYDQHGVIAADAFFAFCLQGAPRAFKIHLFPFRCS
eukprot:tig00000269_g23754.t1